MAAIGGLDLSLISAQQKLALGLAHFNFDFSLVKIEAPAEYLTVGACLSKRRKQEAETGPLHIVARKLGALFASDIPAAPRLFALMDSELLKSQVIRPSIPLDRGVTVLLQIMSALMLAVSGQQLPQVMLQLLCICLGAFLPASGKCQKQPRSSARWWQQERLSLSVGQSQICSISRMLLPQRLS